MFLVGHLRETGAKEIFPVWGTASEDRIQIVGHNKDYRRNLQAFSSEGLTEALSTCQGGGREHHVAFPVFCDMNYGAGIKLTKHARTLQARYHKGVNKRPAENSGVAVSVLGNMNFSQDGKIHDPSGVSQCLSAGHNNSPKVAVPILTPDRDRVAIGMAVRKRDTGMVMEDNGTEQSNALTSNCKHHLVGIIDPQGRNEKEVEPKELAPTLRSQTHGNQPQVVTRIADVGEPGKDGKFSQGNRVYDSNAVAACLTSQSVGGAGGNTALYAIRVSQCSLVLQEKTDSDYEDVIDAVWCDKYQSYIAIRKLTPRECFRLQGFTDEYFNRAAEVNSNTQLYKQAGNSVTVSAVQAIAQRLR